MFINSVQQFKSIIKLIYLIIVIALIFTLGFISYKQIVKASQVGNLAITGTNISNSSANISTAITPIITFSLPNGLNTSNNLILVLNGLITTASISSANLLISGGCSGTPNLASSLGIGVTNPTFTISNLTCTNAISSISISAGKLNTFSYTNKANIIVSSPLDFGQFIFFIGGGNQVNVTAQVGSIISIKIYPEKRIPSTGNWQNQNTIQIRPVGSSTPIVSQVVNMNVNGDGTMTSIDPVILPSGTYDFAIKGYSHLRKVYTGSISTVITNLDFSGTGNEMLAGDTSLIEDNYINSLDLSNMSRNLYTVDIKSDLNRDNGVNSLDLSNLSFNMFKSGSN